MVDIPIGEELVFSRDENITAKVVKLVGQQTIEYKGEVTSLSASAKDALDARRCRIESQM